VEDFQEESIQTEFFDVENHTTILEEEFEPYNYHQDEISLDIRERVFRRTIFADERSIPNVGLETKFGAVSVLLANQT
jgi:hypothetical protein